MGYVNFRLVLAKGICILPLQRLNPVLLQLLTFDTPWRGFRVEGEALCAPGKLVEQVFRQLNIFRNWFHNPYPSVQFSSVAKLCPTIWDPMDCCTQSFLVLYHLPKFAQVHVHWVCNAIQPSHPLLSQSLHLLISRKALNPFMVTSAPQTSKKPLVKEVLDCTELPLHQNLIYWPHPTAALEQSLRGIWGVVPWAASSFCPK